MGTLGYCFSLRNSSYWLVLSLALFAHNYYLNHYNNYTNMMETMNYSAILRVLTYISNQVELDILKILKSFVNIFSPKQNKTKH